MKLEKKVFESQQEDEKIILIVRRHWLTLFPSLIVSFAIYLIGTISIFIFPRYFPQIINNLGHSIYVLILSLLFVFSSVQLFVSWIEYYLSINVLTDQHLVDVDQNSLFIRRESILNLDEVQDVSSSIKGFIRTIFDFGDLDVQTAGEEKHFILENIPNPDFVAKKILETAENLTKNKNS